MQFSIVHLSEVRGAFEMRMDAEYWRPDFIRNSRLVSGGRKIRGFIEEKISHIKSSPPHGDFKYLEISNIPLNGFEYETVNIKEGAEPDRAHYILKQGDVAVSTVRPNRNAVALIQKDGIVGSSGLAVLRAKGIEPEYLFAFCKTGYFVKNLMRANKATMYPAVSLKDILDMPLPPPSPHLRGEVSRCVRKAVSLAAKSKNMSKKAHAILLSELGLSDWRPKHQLAFIKRLSDTADAGRLDAEYFQPKHEKLANKIKNYKGGWEMLGNLAGMIKGSEVGKKAYSEEGVPFVRVSDIRPEEIIKGKFISHQLYCRLKESQPQKGEILLTKDASCGIARHLRDAPEKMAVSSGILRLQNKSNKINNSCLTLILNSIITKEQMNRDATGFVILHWKPDQIKQTLIPILSKEKQIQIERAAREAHNWRKKSKELLLSAQSAVERAMEHDEKSALAWLKAQKCMKK